MGSRIRTLIVDDEPLARRGIRRLLETEADIVVVGEASNGLEARAAIESLSPDLVFVDIQMPKVDGLSLIDSLDNGVLPEIVFVTAYDEHAIRAFDSGAIDYVLKPINSERFQKTLDRVRRRIFSADDKRIESKIAEVLGDLVPAGAAFLKRVAVRHGERIRFLNSEQIDWIGSQGNYIEIHSGDDKFLLRETMDGISKKLDPQDFLRIRRSKIVRVGSIKELQTLFGGEFTVVLHDGTELVSSRRYRKNVESFLTA